MEDANGEYVGASRLSLLRLMRVTEYGIIAYVGKTGSWKFGLT